MTRFRHADELDDLLHDRPASAPRPTDDPELDAFASRVVDAFTRVDAVEIPGIGRFEIREKEARRGATVDGDPTVVPRRRLVVFTAAPDLKKALNAAVRGG